MQPRIVVIGGGIAGLAFALCYKKLGGRVDIYERSPCSGREGLGFIMLENGLNALTHLNLLEQTQKAGFALSSCEIRDNQNNLLKNQSLPNSFGTTRKAFVDCLLAEIPADWLHFGYQFSHFNFNADGSAQAAVFSNGEAIPADIFLGCDGGRSQVREQIFPQAPTSAGKVTELVSILDAPDLVKQFGKKFTKFKQQQGGLATGFLPTDHNKIVWFIQFDSEKYHLIDNSYTSKWLFAQEKVGHWPNPIQYLINHTDFKNSHLWQTRYLMPLTRYYKQNIVLLGDAAHVLLPFTSQGVNSAIVDAIELAGLLNKIDSSSLAGALNQFTAKRKPISDAYLKQGIVLQEEFLQPHHAQQKVPFAF
jgi:2-polyprenyl-6-methoxyphenol hydroxylase-like FAD-dependent oxidoreductase